MDLVLASGSTWRLSLLESAGIRCRAVAPEVDETVIIGDSPVATARARALVKAQAVAAGIPLGSWALGADQVVHLDGTILGKPRGLEAHVDMLTRLRGRRHSLVTAVALVSSPGGGEPRCFDVHTHLNMRAGLGDAELRSYAACGEASGCGGGYMIEARGVQLFEMVDGDWNNVVGLPLFRLITELRSMGWRPTFERALCGGALGGLEPVHE